jgi:hypothetical protein
VPKVLTSESSKPGEVVQAIVAACKEPAANNREQMELFSGAFEAFMRINWEPNDTPNQ